MIRRTTKDNLFHEKGELLLVKGGVDAPPLARERLGRVGVVWRSQPL
jgi:hypothetical protein